MRSSIRHHATSEPEEVFDRPKTIVEKGGKGRDIEPWNATFAQAIVDMGVGVATA